MIVAHMVLRFKWVYLEPPKMDSLLLWVSSYTRLERGTSLASLENRQERGTPKQKTPPHQFRAWLFGVLRGTSHHSAFFFLSSAPPGLQLRMLVATSPKHPIAVEN